jgi:hypothetical protein
VQRFYTSPVAGESADKLRTPARRHWRGYKDAPVGQRFGRWTVTGLGTKRGVHYVWALACDCGRSFERQAESITCGKSTQCHVCQAQDAAASRALPTPSRVGGKQRPEYKVYAAMLARCFDPTNKYFYRYGGRGIGVCDAWRESFHAFYADVGPRPGPGYSIERVDNDGEYEPGNIRWATAKEQARNTRRNRWLTVDGRTECVAAWAEEMGVRPQLIFKRLAMGWSEEDAVKRPVGR